MPPLKVFICPSRRTTAKPWADYAGAFTPLQQVPNPVPANDPDWVRLASAYSLWDVPGGGRLTSGMIQDRNHNLDWTLGAGAANGWPDRRRPDIIEQTGFEGIHGGPHPGASPCAWGDGSVRAVKYGLPAKQLCALWGWNDGI